jgi:RHS repeat-associated protein
MLPNFNLINMNGRMYDPLLARMLSPDNYVMPTGTQGYNRYNYANNNPLMYTDPDGNFIHLVVGAIIGAAVNVSVGLINGNINSIGSFAKAFGFGAVSGALSAAIGYGGFGMNAAGRAVTDGFITNAAIFKGIASGIGSSILPAIPIGNNFSISPSFAFGSHGSSAGLSANYTSGNFSLGFGFNNAKGNAGWSAKAGWDDGKTGISYSFNHFSKAGTLPSQNTGTFGFRNNDFNFSWENDVLALGVHDRWRTNGLGFGFDLKNGNNITIGSRFMTGEDNDKLVGDGQLKRFPMVHSESNTNLFREGLLYLQYTNGKGVSISGGIDSENFRYKVMKGIHSLTGDGVFKKSFFFLSYSWLCSLWQCKPFYLFLLI